MGNHAAAGDILGQSYEYLINKFADANNKKAGEFCTPRWNWARTTCRGYETP